MGNYTVVEAPSQHNEQTGTYECDGCETQYTDPIQASECCK